MALRTTSFDIDCFVNLTARGKIPLPGGRLGPGFTRNALSLSQDCSNYIVEPTRGLWGYSARTWVDDDGIVSSRMHMQDHMPIASERTNFFIDFVPERHLAASA